MKRTFKAMIGGFLISCASTLCMITTNYTNPICGALIFPVGLYLVFRCGGTLITGKAFTNTVDWQQKEISFTMAVVDMINVICGNYLGCIWGAIVFKNKWTTMPVIPQISWQIVIESMLCCCCIALAVCLYKKSITSFGKAIGTWIPTASFVILGWKHSVVYLFYLALKVIDLSWTINDVLTVLIIIAGNILGGIIFAIIRDYLN